MTLKEIMDGGYPTEGATKFEEIPDEALAIDAPEAGAGRARIAALRHLAIGASLTTLCGLPKEGAEFAHPSKARKADCQACKDAYRKNRVPSESPEPMKAGDRIEIVGGDGSAWLVTSARPGGADVRCLLDGSQYRKGATLTISAGSPARRFTEEEWRIASRAEPKATKPAAAGEPKAPSAAKWAPTKADVDAVREFRRLGHSYIQIEGDMGWPAMHGNRGWRIMKGAWQYDLLREK
jgi:hypothetical protein